MPIPRVPGLSVPEAWNSPIAGTLLGLLILSQVPGGAVAMAAGAIVLLLIGAAALWRLEIAAYLLILCAFSLDWLADELAIMPHALTWLIEGLIAYLALRALSSAMLRGRLVLPHPTLVLFALLAISIGIALANGTDPFRIGLGARAIFKYPLLFLALVNLRLPERFYRRGVGLLLFLVALQPFVALWQFAFLGYFGDTASGTVRSVGYTTILAVMVLCLCAGLATQYRRKWRYLVAFPVLILLPLLGEGKAFFLLLPPAMAVLFYRSALQRPARTALVLAFSLTAFMIGMMNFANVRGNAAPLSQIFTDPAAFLSDPTVARSWVPRVASVATAHAAVRTDPAHMLFGLGLGSRAATHEEVTRRGSQIQLESPLGTWISELGYGGALLLLCAVLHLYFRARRAFDPADVSYWNGIAFGYTGAVFAYAAAIPYTDVLSDPLALSFWFIGAALVALTTRRDPAAPRSPLTSNHAA